MKTVKFKNSILFFFINPKKDTVSCYFFFFIAFFSIKTEKQTFDLKKLSFSQVVEFYKTLSNDCGKKYHI